MAIKKLVEVWDGKNIIENNINFLKQKTKEIHLPINDTNKEISYKFELASKILSKYPDYDPSWNSDVQIKWLDGMNKLYEILSNEE